VEKVFPARESTFSKRIKSETDLEQRVTSKKRGGKRESRICVKKGTRGDRGGYELGPRKLNESQKVLGGFEKKEGGQNMKKKMKKEGQQNPPNKKKRRGGKMIKKAGIKKLGTEKSRNKRGGYNAQNFKMGQNVTKGLGGGVKLGVHVAGRETNGREATKRGDLCFLG